jgi:hypothetical protein
MQSKIEMIIILLMIIALLTGCMPIEDVISEEEAKQLVIEKRTTENSYGTVDIISVEIKRNSYYIEWENKKNTEWGIDRVTKDGKVHMLEATID